MIGWYTFHSYTIFYIAHIYSLQRYVFYSKVRKVSIINMKLLETIRQGITNDNSTNQNYTVNLIV